MRPGAEHCPSNKRWRVVNDSAQGRGTGTLISCTHHGCFRLGERQEVGLYVPMPAPRASEPPHLPPTRRQLSVPDQDHT